MYVGDSRDVVGVESCGLVGGDGRGERVGGVGYGGSDGFVSAEGVGGDGHGCG